VHYFRNYQKKKPELSRSVEEVCKLTDFEDIDEKDMFELKTETVEKVIIPLGIENKRSQTKKIQDILFWNIRKPEYFKICKF
jgi:hypothetical protein